MAAICFGLRSILKLKFSSQRVCTGALVRRLQSSSQQCVEGKHALNIGCDAGLKYLSKDQKNHVSILQDSKYFRLDSSEFLELVVKSYLLSNGCLILAARLFLRTWLGLGHGCAQQTKQYMSLNIRRQPARTKGFFRASCIFA